MSSWFQSAGRQTGTTNPHEITRTRKEHEPEPFRITVQLQPQDTPMNGSTLERAVYCKRIPSQRCRQNYFRLSIYQNSLFVYTEREFAKGTCDEIAGREQTLEDLERRRGVGAQIFVGRAHLALTRSGAPSDTKASNAFLIKRFLREPIHSRPARTNDPVPGH